MDPVIFQQKILSWFDLHGRKDLPWQQPATPYRVWISEIMLQQTQVATVIPYFEKFMNRFPCVEALSDAPLDEVLLHWAGLGYYARARNLHKSARLIAANGTFPNCFDDLVELPGIGRSTAGAILSLAFGRSHPILDGNVKRVLARFEGITGWPGNNATAEALWAVSSRYTPVHRVGEYTQAMMDLGATLCTRSKPDCPVCPLKDECHARRYEQTASLPTPKPSRTQPVKRVCFLWVTDRDRQTFLQQRPAAGIWGGLWSLPEFDSPESARVWCLSRNIVITRLRQLPEQRHSFSHYHLDYTPLHVETEHPPDLIMESGQTVWYKAGQRPSLALAAPIKRLLQQFYEETL